MPFSSLLLLLSCLSTQQPAIASRSVESQTIETLEHRIVDVEQLTSAPERADALEQTLAEFGPLIGFEHTLIQQVQNRLATDVQQWNPQKAEQIWLSILALNEQNGERSQFSRLVQYNLGVLYMTQVRLEEAREQLMAVMEKQRKRAPRHSLMAQILERLVEIDLFVANYAAAEQHGERLLKFYQRRDGRQAETTLSTKALLGMIYIEQGKVDDAQRILERTLALQERNMHPFESRLTTQQHLARLSHLIGQEELALGMYQQILTDRMHLLGSEHLDTLSTKNNLALLMIETGNIVEAEQLLDECLVAYRQILGTKHPTTIAVMNNTAMLYEKEGRTLEAKQLVEIVLRAEQGIFPPHHPDVLTATSNLATLLMTLGDQARAEELLMQSIELSESHSEWHPYQWTIQSNLATVYMQQGRSTKAEEVLVRLLEEQEDVFGSLHPQVLQVRSSLLNLYLSQGRLEEADEYLQILTTMIEAQYPTVHPLYLQLLTDQATVAFTKGNAETAKTLLKSLLSIQEGHLGHDHPNTLHSMRTIGQMLQSQGDYLEAEHLLQAVVDTQLKTIGETHPDYLSSLVLLANLYEAQGEYSKAEPALLTVVHSARGLFGAAHPYTQNALMNLASLYQSQGRYAEAETIFQTVIQTFEALIGREHPYSIQALNRLADLYVTQERFDAALPILEDIVELSSSVFGGEHPDAFQALGAYALGLQEVNRLDEARPIFERVLQFQREKLGDEHPNTLVTKNNLANIAMELGDVSVAQQLLAEALQTQEVKFGKTHPDTLKTLYNLCNLTIQTKDWTNALKYGTALVSGEGVLLRKNFVASEATQRQFFDTFSNSTGLLVSMHLLHAPDNTEIAQLAFETWMNRQGRVLDAQSNMLDALRTSLDDNGQRLMSRRGQLILQEADLRAQLATNVTVELQSQLQNNQVEFQDLERQLSAYSTRFSNHIQDVTIEDVIQSLPMGGVFVQYAVIPLEMKGVPTEVLVGYSLRKDGEIQGQILGKVSDFSEKIKAFRQTRSSTLARELYHALLAPVFDLSEVQHVFISPDGPLNNLPFDVLKISDTEFLVDVAQTTLMTSARELVAIQSVPSQTLTSNTDITMFANPNFGTQSDWNPLPGTVQEAAAVSQLFGQIIIAQGNDATISKFRDLKDPTILHIATHGFVDEDDPLSIADDNPLTRTGLVFASSDGIQEDRLLASEVVGLSLSNTSLVVLSACESGLGDTSNGDGVYGLRRAFTFAGAHSQVVSLWPVSDAGTQFFMTQFYSHLSSGTSKSSALRQAKLDMKQSTQWHAPIFWGAFVLAGDWR